MKVVLFCGGLGMRMREYSEAMPKPMVPIGYRPILWHVMKYYAHYGHKDFVLCLGYKADVIKRYFLEYNECLSNDFVLTQGGKNLELLSSDIHDWNITFVDTGLVANIGQRLKAVQKHLQGEEMFLANYSDGLSDLPLPTVIDSFQRSRSIACFVSVKPRASFHLIHTDTNGIVKSIEHLGKSDARINGGFMALRQEIFGYMHEGRHVRPWQRALGGVASSTLTRESNVITCSLDGVKRVLCLGAHSDDIEIGCGGTILHLIGQSDRIEFYWLVLSSNPERAQEAQRSANAFLRGAHRKTIVVKPFRDGFLPYLGAPVKECFEDLKKAFVPDLIFTHCRHDLHQDHRLVCELTWNTFRNHLILEYEIPKYDADLRSPNFFVPLRESITRKKLRWLMRFFGTQRNRQWFSEDLFQGLMRLRGIEAPSPTRYAEAFFCRKLLLGGAQG
jgi:glucose-1-phosphate cytidylyltransferase